MFGSICGSSLQPLGEQKRLFDYLSQAEILARGLDDPHRLAQILCYMSGYFIQAENDPARAVEVESESLHDRQHH